MLEKAVQQNDPEKAAKILIDMAEATNPNFGDVARQMLIDWKNDIQYNPKRIGIESLLIIINTLGGGFLSNELLLLLGVEKSNDAFTGAFMGAIVSILIARYDNAKKALSFMKRQCSLSSIE